MKKGAWQGALHFSITGLAEPGVWPRIFRLSGTAWIISTFRKQKMNKTNSNTTLPDAQEEFVESTGKPTHQRFSWLGDGMRGNMTPEYVAMVKDVTSGVALMLGLVQRSNLDRDGNAVPVLGIQDTETMLLAAMRATEILHAQTEEMLDTLASIHDHQIADRLAAETDAGATRTTRARSPA